MFPCVWLHFKKFSWKYFLVFGKEEGKHKSRKHKPQPRKKSSTIVISPTRSRDGAISRSRDRAVDCDLDPARSCEGEIAIDGAISRSVNRGRRTGAREISADWSSEYAGDRRIDWSSVFSSRARARSLSLSLFPEILWSENEGRKSFPSQRWKYWSTESHFPENNIFRDSQTRGFCGKWFLETVFTQFKHNPSAAIENKFPSFC